MVDDLDWVKLEKAENDIHFDPVKGNVLFGSAFYGYAFALDDFAKLWENRIEGISRKEFCQFLFSSDHYLAIVKKQILPDAENKGKKSLFEQLILDPLWEIHKCALIDKDLEKLNSLAKKLGLSLGRGAKRSVKIYVKNNGECDELMMFRFCKLLSITSLPLGLFSVIPISLYLIMTFFINCLIFLFTF